MIDKEKLHKMDRKYASWLIEVAKTKDMADEVVKLCDEVMRDIEKDGDTTELLFENIYISPVKDSIMEFMGFIKEAEKFIKITYSDMAGEHDEINAGKDMLKEIGTGLASQMSWAFMIEKNRGPNQDD